MAVATWIRNKRRDFLFKDHADLILENNPEIYKIIDTQRYTDFIFKYHKPIRVFESDDIEQAIVLPIFTYGMPDGKSADKLVEWTGTTDFINIVTYTNFNVDLFRESSIVKNHKAEITDIIFTKAGLYADGIKVSDTAFKDFVNSSLPNEDTEDFYTSIILGTDNKLYIYTNADYCIIGSLYSSLYDEGCFEGFSALTSFDLSDNDTFCLVTNSNFTKAFANCTELETLKLPDLNYDSDNIKIFNSAFLNCSSLYYIYLENFKDNPENTDGTQNGIYCSDDMPLFKGCKRLPYAWNYEDYENKKYACIENGYFSNGVDEKNNRNIAYLCTAEEFLKRIQGDYQEEMSHADCKNLIVKFSSEAKSNQTSELQNVAADFSPQKIYCHIEQESYGQWDEDTATMTTHLTSYTVNFYTPDENTVVELNCHTDNFFTNSKLFGYTNIWYLDRLNAHIVKTATGLFAGNTKMETLYASNLHFNNYNGIPVKIDNMFKNCTLLRRIFAPDWLAENGVDANSSDVFLGCPELRLNSLGENNYGDIYTAGEFATIGPEGLLSSIESMNGYIDFTPISDSYYSLENDTEWEQRDNDSFTFNQGETSSLLNKYLTINYSTGEIRFLKSGKLILHKPMTVDLFAVGGGGAGGYIYGGGGGSGYTSTVLSQELETNYPYIINVGLGGATSEKAFYSVDILTATEEEIIEAFFPGGETSVVDEEDNILISAAGGEYGASLDESSSTVNPTVFGGAGGSAGGNGHKYNNDNYYTTLNDCYGCINSGNSYNGIDNINTTKTYYNENGGITQAFGDPDGELFASGGNGYFGDDYTYDFSNQSTVDESSEDTPMLTYFVQPQPFDVTIFPYVTYVESYDYDIYDDAKYCYQKEDDDTWYLKSIENTGNGGAGVNSDYPFEGQAINYQSVFEAKNGGGSGIVIMRTPIDPADRTYIFPQENEGNTELTEVEYENVTTIGDLAFAECYNLTTAIFPAVKTIGSSAFANDINLTTFSDDDNLQTIYQNAFRGCTTLSDINLYNCQYIDKGAFYNCYSLTHVSLTNCSYIGESAFYHCNMFPSVTISDCTIGSYAFFSCTQLTSAMITNASIGNRAFGYCASLSQASIYITDSTLSQYYINCFDNCTSLANIDIINPYSIPLIISGFNNCAIDRFVHIDNQDGSLLLYDNATDIIDIEENGVANTNLTYVYLDKCSKVGTSAFASCSQLTTITLPICTTLGSYAFKDCSNLTSIYLGQYSVLGQTLITYYDGDTSMSYQYGIFDGCNENLSIYVPSQYLNAYKTASQFSDYASHFYSIPEDEYYIGHVTDIYTSTLDNYKNLPITFLRCNNSQMTVLSSIMNNNSYLRSVNASYCQEVAAYAFYHCSNLSNVSLEKCSKYGSHAFEGTSLNTFPSYIYATTSNKSSIYIGEYAFRYAKMSSVSIANCDIIHTSAFFNCTNLTQLTINSPTEIGDYAFANCTNLVQFSLSQCTSIGVYAFFSGLYQDINLPECSQIGSYALATRAYSINSLSLPKCQIIEDYAFGKVPVNTFNFNELHLPECLSIGNNVFYQKPLSVIDIPKCTFIGELAFGYNTYLKNLELSAPVAIHKEAFYSCTNLTTVSLPNCTALYESAFTNCSKLTTVYLGNCSYMEIPFQSCLSLASLYLGYSSVVSFSNLYGAGLPNSTMTIYVPSSLVSAYRANSFWKNYYYRISSYNFG